MTEHAAVIFVFFFLAEYASIVLICTLNAILFLGGYLDFTSLFYIIPSIFDIVGLEGNNIILFFKSFYILFQDIFNVLYYPLIEGIIYGLSIGVKSCLMIFVFIWVRASFPRIRFDQLMSFSWTILLPIVIAFIVFIPCLIYSFDIISSNIYLF